MRITIDNLDGAGARDYSAAVSPEGPLKIERTLNEPARCTGMLDLSALALPVPVRQARVVVVSDAGAQIFVGYLATAPARLYAGRATTGPVHWLIFNAMGDQTLLDRKSVLLGQDSALGSVTHAVGDGDGVLALSPMKTTSVRELASDVTLVGDVEPAAYISETFAGDGTTTVFNLAEAPYRSTRTADSIASTSVTQVLLDHFDQGTLNGRVWTLRDPGSFLSLTSKGLTMSGGNGFDGQTTVTANDLIEMGGTLVVEASGVQMASPSTGVVCGFYNGAIEALNCFAGYNVRQSNGTTVLVPLVNGAEAGTPYTLLNGHRYTLRIRLHCPETERVRQTWHALADGVLQAFGGGVVAAPMSLLFELVDEGVSSNTQATVLYAGTVTNSPASCNFAVVNSVELEGSLAYCGITQEGSVWIVSTLHDGTQVTRMTGAAGDGVDCSVSSAGRITFFDGRIPVAGERFTVWYRGRRRAVARRSDSARVSVEEAAGAFGTMQWVGHVTQPPARSTEDCENAALAVLSFSAGRAAAIAGSYTIVNPAEDIQPGDMLAISSGAGSGDDTLKVLVRKVTIEDGHALPEVAVWRLDFANEWAEGLGLRCSEEIPKDTLLPAAAESASSAALANLQSLQVTSATGTALQIDTGINPPASGGFEVRRRDWAFGPGVNSDLVLRSPVRSFAIPREGQVERYYVRMYDGSNPPVYSRLSSAVFTNLPVEL